MVRWNAPNPDLETKGKYHAADFIPFDMPDSLDDLRGSKTMRFSLPVTVYWGPRREPFDMSVENDVVRAYTELISHADKGMQEAYLNRDLLLQVWNDLFLDRHRVRPAWEKKFPELKGVANE